MFVNVQAALATHQTPDCTARFS